MRTGKGDKRKKTRRRWSLRKKLLLFNTSFHLIYLAGVCQLVCRDRTVLSAKNYIAEKNCSSNYVQHCRVNDEICK